MFWRLQNRLHVSWLIAWLFGGLVLGVFASQYWYSQIWLYYGVPLGLIFALGVFAGRRYWMVGVIIVAGFLIGLGRGSVVYHDFVSSGQFVGQMATVTGFVSDDITNKADNISFAINNLTIEGKTFQGEIWVSVDKVDLKRGDKVELRGAISPGFGNFLASMYRAEVVYVAHPDPPDLALQSRDWFAEKIGDSMTLEEAGLAVGYLVGKKQALSAELNSALVIAGLTHVVVASGYNLTILVRLARRVLSRHSKYLAFYVGLVLVVAFVLVTGFSPSMSRAAVVAVISLGAWYYGRKLHPMVILSIAGGLSVLYDPSYAWGDLGWQLSFAAFFGVMVLAPLMQSYFLGDRNSGWLGQVLIETTAAWIMTLPIIASSFGQVSVISVFANALVLPLVPLAMLLSFIAGLGAVILPAFATLIGLPAAVLLGYMINVVYFAADLPWASLDVEIDGLVVAVAFGLIGLACWYMKHQTKMKLLDVNVVE
jgi:competence protein ComEC